MAAPTSVPIVSKLSTEYTPGHVQIIIELTPKDGETFDVPPKEIVKELGPSLNYILFRFTGEEGDAPTPENRAAAKKAEQDEKDRVDKMIAEGQARSLAGFEKALKRAKAGKNPAEIADAEVALERVKARIRANDA